MSHFSIANYVSLPEPNNQWIHFTAFRLDHPVDHRKERRIGIAAEVIREQGPQAGRPLSRL